MSAVYLVITDQGLHRADLDPDVAHHIARLINGVVAEVPIVADYRLPATSDATQENKT